MTIDAFERAHPIVLHARLGAAIAQEAFAVHDAEVLSAIEKHTVAAARMSALDCALYLADALEPGRDHDTRDTWALALRDLHAGMHAALVSSLQHLAQQGLSVAPQTVAAAHAFGVSIEEVASFPT